MYTNEQLESLRQIPIIEVIRQLGLNHLQKEGTYYRIKDQSMNVCISIEKNKYFDNLNDKKGFGAISFLQDIFGYSFVETIKLLQGINTNEVVNEVINNNANNAIPDPVSANLQNVVDYLTKIRKINPDIIQRLIYHDLLYADHYSNCVFINSDKSFAYVRSIKGKYVSNRGKMNFLIVRLDKSNQIYLFESIIDLLSYITIYPSDKGLMVSTNGSAMINKLNELNLQKFDKVFCCFDNDSQGINFDNKVKAIIPNAIIKKPSNGKDFNDQLVFSTWQLH